MVRKTWETTNINNISSLLFVSCFTSNNNFDICISTISPITEVTNQVRGQFLRSGSKVRGRADVTYNVVNYLVMIGDCFT